MNWAIIAAGLISGILGAMGLGGGGILIIYLSIFACVNQSTAQGINLIFFIPIALVAIAVYIKKKLIVWKIAIPFAILGVLGTLVGSWLSGMINNNILSKMFGVLLLIIGIKELFTKSKLESK
ncbi:MAG: sulfite exporter TauE/SafE family protein [Bacillota bacterium]|nr:sulfite exporter TauE/SafE family protein [Bacillota bacterium]